MSLESLFKQHTGAAPVSCEALTGSASHRRYYRLTGADGRTLIGVAQGQFSIVIQWTYSQH